MFNYGNFWELISRIEHVNVRDFLDVVIVFLIVYELLKLVRGTRAVPMAFGIVVLAMLYQLAHWLELTVVQAILRYALNYSPIAIIVLFQTEIRAALTHIGKTLRNPLAMRENTSARRSFDEVVLAATTLATKKIGMLVVIEREVGLQNLIDAGVRLDAALTYDLLVTIFDTHTPLHDGAVIVRNDRIASAGCFLPLTLNPRLSKELGTRHRAAIGITEDGDAVAVVVSEETGTISFVSGGNITRNLDSARLREMLRQSFEPRLALQGLAQPKRRRRRRRSRRDIETTVDMASDISTTSG
ncbi:MAG TPA: diadenylate cyclase CdaA [Blastocatellia bacterium]|nr:diadenylate cyclase CdaA [Blastocatellia bacterium]